MGDFDDSFDTIYLTELRRVFMRGAESTDRTGTGTIRYPGVQMRYDLSKGTFPLLTTKRVAFYPMLIELLWFLQGRNDHKWLQDRKCNIWNEWSTGDGTIGQGYGVQWRKWPKGAIHKIDQIKQAIDTLKNDPNSRRNIVSAWNVSELDEMALPPCHAFFQFQVIGKKLYCHLTQRSGDMFLGVPFNVASYSLLTVLLARECDLEPAGLIHNIADAHIYKNHVDQVQEQIGRWDKEKEEPSIHIDNSIFEDGLMKFVDSRLKDLSLEQIKELIYPVGYEPHPTIKAPVAI